MEQFLAQYTERSALDALDDEADRHRRVRPETHPPVSVVTGGCGFVGKHLVNLLLLRGHQVRVIDIDGREPLPEQVELVQASVLDSAATNEIVADADFVFHLAANPNLWAADKQAFEEVNLNGTRSVLDAAHRAKCARIVYTSTESILVGHKRGRQIIDETVELATGDVPGAYCRSKLLAERYARQLARQGAPVVIVNPTLPVGPGDHRLTPPSQMLLDFLNGIHPGFLNFHMNMIDVRAVALGHWLAAARGRVGERYILGGNNLTLAELLVRLNRMTGLSMPKVSIPYPIALAFATVCELVADCFTRRAPRASTAGVRLARASVPFSSDKAERELGLPRVPLEGTLNDAIAWFDEQGLLQRQAHLQRATSV